MQARPNTTTLSQDDAGLFHRLTGRRYAVDAERVFEPCQVQEAHTEQAQHTSTERGGIPWPCWGKVGEGLSHQRQPCDEQTLLQALSLHNEGLERHA